MSVVVHRSVDASVATTLGPERTRVGGTYLLVFALESPVEVRVGSLGDHDLPAGGYGYVGSARGPGGFVRVDRHRRHLRGEESTVHWHVDAVTTRPEARFVGAVLAPGVDAECSLATRLPDGAIPRFGASDCACRSHLSVGTPSALLGVGVEVLKNEF